MENASYSLGTSGRLVGKLVRIKRSFPKKESLMNSKPLHSVIQLFLVFILLSNQMNAESNLSIDFSNKKNTMDNIAPTAICDQNTVVAIGQSGTSIVQAITFDDGSTDNVGIVLMEVRRMDSPACPGSDGTAFGPTVPFYCCDIGTTVMVEFRVSDAAGNTNSCMVEVEAQDKLNPVIYCPADISILCTEYPNPSLTGEATAIDNCETNVTVAYNDISITENDCGEGEITRVWTATAGSGAYSTASCIQIITVTNPSYFEEDDITWPLDYEAMTCGIGLEPENLPAPYNEPILDEGNCNNVAVGHTDQVLEFGGSNACLKILRKWHVVDWCQASNNPDPTQPGPGIWHYTQVLKIVNSSAPTITSFVGEATIDNYEADCGSTTATFEILADDDCTEQSLLEYSWEFSTGLSGTGTSASGEFLNGNYSLTFTVNDQCGNSVWEIHDFEVKDAKLPTPICLFGIATVVMPSSGAVTIWATDFEEGSSYDNCTAYDDLKFSFSPDVNFDSLIIDCADIPADGLVPISIYVTDEAGNQDFCSTFVSMQDPNGICLSGDPIIAGAIENEYQELVEEVTVSLVSDTGMLFTPVVTGVNGNFTFATCPMNVEIVPEKNINYLNGVTTFDLVLIAKHILGTELLDSPYKIIAADANHSKSITALDLVKIRALILHIDDELENSESWRFVAADYVFPDPNNPFQEVFPEVINAMNLNGNPSNFIALKVGDVNGTASPNSLLGSDIRTFDGEVTIQLQNQEVAKGETFTVDFRAKDFKNIEGYQFTLGFEKEAVEFVDVMPKLEGLNESNFGFAKLDEGKITTSWNSTKGTDLDENAILFSMTFKAKSAGEIANIFEVNSHFTAAEAYAGSNLYDVKLSFDSIRNKTFISDFKLYQNTPNPFGEETIINFYLPKSETVILKIYDISGRVLSQIEVVGVEGFNSKKIKRANFDTTGILYYQVKTNKKTITKKMVLLD